MSTPDSQSPRRIAAEIICDFYPHKDFITSSLNEHIDRTTQRQKVTDLVFGSLRNRIAIDTVIESFAQRRVNRISKPLLNILRIACYELIYCPDTAAYAIINDAVENTKEIAATKQAGFVNAVLRQIDRHISNRQIELNDGGKKNSLPQNILTCCQFDNDFLPDPENDFPRYLHICHSLPTWLISNWLQQFGPNITQKICYASNRRPSVYIRPNTLKISTNDLLEKLQHQQIDCELVTIKGDSEPGPIMLRLRSPQQIIELPGFTEGLFTVQDITASKAVAALAVQPGWRILDLCSAPGIKTTQIAQVTNDSAQIIATDVNSQRLKKVTENINRLELKSIQVVEYKQFKLSLRSNGLYDAILLDVPCSNTGVLSKRLEVRYRINRQAIAICREKQKLLLEFASTLVKPTGRICYSTCSIQNDENSCLIKNFLIKNPSFSLEYEKLILPNAEGFDYDGGYIAVIVKKVD